LAGDNARGLQNELHLLEQWIGRSERAHNRLAGLVEKGFAVVTSSSPDHAFTRPASCDGQKVPIVAPADHVAVTATHWQPAFRLPFIAGHFGRSPPTGKERALAAARLGLHRVPAGKIGPQSRFEIPAQPPSDCPHHQHAVRRRIQLTVPGSPSNTHSFFPLITANLSRPRSIAAPSRAIGSLFPLRRLTH